MVTSHSIGHDSRRDQHGLHQSVMGHQNALHGTWRWSNIANHDSYDDLVLSLAITEWAFLIIFQTQSRDETRYRHTLDAALTIYRSEGIRAFYRGLVPSLLGIAHVAVQFPLYERLKIIARTQPFYN